MGSYYSSEVSLKVSFEDCEEQEHTYREDRSTDRDASVGHSFARLLIATEFARPVSELGDFIDYVVEELNQTSITYRGEPYNSWFDMLDQISSEIRSHYKKIDAEVKRMASKS